MVLIASKTSRLGYWKPAGSVFSTHWCQWCSRNVFPWKTSTCFLGQVWTMSSMNQPDSVFTVVQYQGQCTLNTHLTIAPNPIGRAVPTAEMVSSKKASHSQVTSLLVARCHQRFLVLYQNLKFFEAKRLRQKSIYRTVCVYENGFNMMTMELLLLLLLLLLFGSKKWGSRDLLIRSLHLLGRSNSNSPTSSFN